jgi:hypothetical protein
LRTTSKSGVQNQDLNIYYNMICDLAKESFDKPVEEIEINTFSFPIDRKNIPLAKEIICKCRNQLSQISEKDQPDQIYQASLMLFPLTK